MAEDNNKSSKSDVNNNYNQAFKGLNMDNIPSQIDKGALSYALNAAVENFDNNSITYQNEPANEFCFDFPDNYVLIGKHLIPEQSKQVFFLANVVTGDSEIGYMYNNDCIYHTLINAKCLNFDARYPIHKSVHRTSNCGTELYWAQPNADRRYINLDITKIPMIALPGSTPCDEHLTDQLDCNQIRVQPNYSIPELEVEDVIIGGNLIAGGYQFAIQYSDARGNPLSSFHSVTNVTPIGDPNVTTVSLSYPVGKSIIVHVSNIETGGQFEYFNLAVIKTINAITSVELVGTYNIDGSEKDITYAGQNETLIRLTINDIFEKFPFYGPADDVTTAQDVLIWKGLSTGERISYQNIANKISLLWETVRIPSTKNYSDELLATNFRGYLRDEVYAFEFVPLLRSGKQADSFHIPGRILTQTEIAMPNILPSNDDFIEDPEKFPLGAPYWRIYNTATVLGSLYPVPAPADPSKYEGPYQYGAMAYWESEDEYSCDESMWGELAGQKIRHHKFPDVEVSPIIESSYNSSTGLVMGNDAIFPIGIRVDIEQIKTLIKQSDLSDEQKADIIGFKIVRGDRTDNKSIVAKGMLRNVGKYDREGQEFYYPNYPYNDLREDPFILSKSNAQLESCKSYDITINMFNNTTNPAEPFTELQYTDCVEGQLKTIKYTTLGVQGKICSAGIPTLVGTGKFNYFFYPESGPPISYWPDYDPSYSSVATATLSSYDIWRISVGGGIFETCSGATFSFDGWTGVKEEAGVGKRTTVLVYTKPGASAPVCSASCGNLCNTDIDFSSSFIGPNCLAPDSPIAIQDDPLLALRQIFNSPETSFGQPFLGDVLKLESVMFGKGQAHFVQVKDNAKYRLLSKEAQGDALTSAGNVGGGDATATFTAYQAYLQIYINGITKKNYAYSFNSIADYNYSVAVPDDLGIKQRRLDLKRYLIPAILNVGEENVDGEAVDINNYQRESSVYLKTDVTKTPFLYPHLSPNMIPINIQDVSRFTLGCGSQLPCASTSGGTTTTTTTLVKPYCPGTCDEPDKKQDITVVSYYASLKNTFRSQWGQLYSYQTIDTGFQTMFEPTVQAPEVVFGGDTFISRFAYKTKVPFFIDNRVGAPDDSEIFYDELGNIGYPKYWHSARSILEDFNVPNLGVMNNIISYKAHNFDCPNCQTPPSSPVLPGEPLPSSNPNRTFYDGIFYLFAYGVPNFYVETSYNVDLRQAYNNKEGDFWPHVSNSIPDEWVQESFVSIANDNTYFYNGSYSKQNIENLFTHIPEGYKFEVCSYIYPFRAIFSDPQLATADVVVNNWLTYRAVSYFDFPQNYGPLTSLDGIDKGQVLARFENKSLLYNALYTTQTNTGGQVYLGQSLFSRSTPPYDYAETDIGYLGSQHKFLLKIPDGQVTIDAKRGQIFLLSGNGGKDLAAPGSGMNRFFTDHLAFEILRYFPNAKIDNNFNGIGLHGVYDSKFDRIIITKLDYIPQAGKNISYHPDTDEYFEVTETEGYNGPSFFETKIALSDPEYFCNKSWTLSYSFITGSWLSFHSYLPNWYIGDNNFFYSGLKTCCSPLKFLAGELVANPPTTTTTTTPFVPPPTTSTTTTVLDCVLVGSARQTDCHLVGTGIVTVPPPPVVCLRPPNVTSFYLYTGYDIITPPSTVVSTGSAVNACNAKQFVASFPSNTVVTQILGWSVNLQVGSKIYADNGTNNCDTIPDGFYFNAVSGSGIYHIVGGVIIDITPCVVVTTTTTTTCNMYIYNVEFNSCTSCSVTSVGSFGNATPLTIGKYYYDSVSASKVRIISQLSCSTGTDRTILDSTKKDFCAEIICP